ncbi:MAG: T9SS type A sorting domain-containing protein [Bacteroidetes bacterium]|nr:T9SS type A sorting domain-containing protein [Bacteroidota bacterium]
MKRSNINIAVIIGLSCLIFFSINLAQAQQITFAKMYPYIGSKEPYQFIELPDSSFVIIGIALDSAGYDFLLRVDKFGDLIWKKKYYYLPGFLAGIQLYQDTLLLATGMYYHQPPNSQHTFTLLNFNGDSIWTNTNSVKTNYVSRLIECSDGGYLTTSACDGTPNVHKFDSLLNMEWFNTVFCYLGIGSMQDFDGNFITYGAGFFDPDSNYYITKLDNFGNVLWERELGNSPVWDLDLYSVDGGCMLPDSNYLFCTNGNDWQLMKVNRYNGDTMWTKRYSFLIVPNGINHSSAHTLFAQYSNDRYITFRNRKLGMINANGDSLWSVNTGLDFGKQSLKPTHDGGIALLGLMYDANWELQITLIKFDSLGNTIFTNQIELPQQDEVSAFPNPANEYVTFALPTAMQSRQVTLTIYDGIGNQILKGTYTVGEAVDISHVPNGLYIATLSNNEIQRQVKFVVLKQ